MLLVLLLEQTRNKKKIISIKKSLCEKAAGGCLAESKAYGNDLLQKRALVPLSPTKKQAGCSLTMRFFPFSEIIA